MLSGLFSLLITAVLLFPFGALASPYGPIAKRQDEDIDCAEEGNYTLTKRYANTKWTYYVVETGDEVSCGGYYHNSDAIVALSGADMNKGYCGKKITMTYGSVTKSATIVDTCPGCPSKGLDLSPSLFSQFASQSKGVIYGSWVFA